MTFAEDVVRAVPIRAKMRASNGAFVWSLACGPLPLLAKTTATLAELSEGHRGCCDGSLLRFLEVRSFPTSQPHRRRKKLISEMEYRASEKRHVSRWHATQPLSTEFRMITISHQATQNTRETTEREEIKLHAESTPYALVYSPIVRS